MAALLQSDFTHGGCHIVFSEIWLRLLWDQVLNCDWLIQKLQTNIFKSVYNLVTKYNEFFRKFADKKEVESHTTFVITRG